MVLDGSGFRGSVPEPGRLLRVKTTLPPSLGPNHYLMKSILTTALGSALVASQLMAADPVELKDQKDKASYSIGVDIGTKLKAQGLELNADALSAGFKDAFSGGKVQLTEDQVRETLMAFSRDMQAKQMEKAKAVGDANKKEGAAFLAENKKKEGVKVTPKGVQYKVITAGKGKTPKATDTVKTHYRGTLINGTEFDSSYKRGEPAEFEVGGVIPGWTEALQMMPVGSKWQLFIPSELAYGEQQVSAEITPHSTLIFDIELLEIVEAK